MKIKKLAILSLLLPSLAAAEGFLDKLPLIGSSQPAFLEPEKAFGLELSAADGNTLIGNFKVTSGYYLYREKIVLTTQDKGIVISAITLPKGEIKHDANFGDMEVYHQPFEARIALARADKTARSVTLHAVYQGCSEQGLCYAPIERDIRVDLPAANPAPTQAAATAATPPAAAGQAAPETDNSKIARLLKQGNFWLIMASFFGAGVLLAFTPCMFPMVPILSGIIVGRGHKITHMHGFILSLAYVLGMALIDAAAGVAAGFSGNLLSNTLQTPWVLVSFAGVFVILSLSMFGFFELQLPSALQSRLADASNKLHGGHLSGVFAMGALSAVIVSPCVTAPMGGALLYIAQTHDAILGGAALFFLGLGMGVPLLVIGASAGALLPKAGAWMESVKRLFGVLLLGVAIGIVAPLLPVGVQMLLWAVLLIVSAVFLHALDALPHNASHWHKLWKGVGVLVLLVGVAFLVGALSGARDVLRPLGAIGSARAAAEGPRFDRVNNLAELDARVAQAGGRIVMLDFYADDCTSCKEMERNTFPDPGVAAKLGNAILLRADLSAHNADDLALLQRFGLFGAPGILFFDKQGKEQPDLRVIGYQDPSQFVRSLQNAGL